ncbi:lysophospholipid acyltransferase family protein [Rhodotorula paludigena]|uniref:lysophospholipid acyltransferase family protein n=1 Tax=Rhodotorula paludigena TaxID=86838 RepID=UPI003176E0AC
MSDSVKRKQRNHTTVAALGPDDPEALLGADFEPRTRPFSVVTTVDPGLTALEPVLVPVMEAPIGYRPAKKGNGEQKNLVENHQAHLRSDPIEFSKQLSLWATGTGWRAYEGYIGQPIFYPGYSDDCIRAIVKSEQLNRRIQHVTEARLAQAGLAEGPEKEKRRRQIDDELRKEAKKLASGLVAKMDNLRFLRFFGAMVNNLLVRMYHQGIEISMSEYARFKEVAQLAAARKQSLLILPCHKSHIDYLTISWLFFRLGLALPHIVAGENLNLPVVGPMLAKCGAFFIRRSFGDDPLYSTVVKEYIEQLLEHGKNIECFIEGSRSRTGKLLPPKLGILKYVLEALENGRTDDVWICPISLQYDKVIETESYVNELLGNPKEKETLSGLLLNTRVIQLQLGRIDVRFQRPFSLRGWVDEQKKRRSAPATTPGVEQPKADQATLLRALGYEVLAGINDSAIIMPTGLVGTIMLTIRGRGVGKSELVSRVQWLKSSIEARGGKVADFGEMAPEEVVDRALFVLKDLVGEQRDLIESTYYPISRFELSFYRNQVIHLFVEEAMLCGVLYTHVKAGGAAPSQRMERADVLRELHFISRLLSNEFVYAPEGLVANAEKTIQALEMDDVILCEGQLMGLSPKERAAGRNDFDFFCFLIWPFIETYWLAAVSLFALTPLTPPPSADQPVAWFAEKAFQASAQLLAKTLFAQGDVSYLEAVNQATLLNAFQRMVDVGVLLTRRSSSPSAAVASGKSKSAEDATKSSKKGKKPVSVPLMALHPDWVPTRRADGTIAPQGRLWEFVDRLSRFRREGKNRRDNKTVSTRVFAHCSAIAPEVVEYSAYQNARPESDFWAEKRQANL